MFDGVSPAIVNYHYKLLGQAGLITLEDLSDLDGENYVVIMFGIKLKMQLKLKALTYLLM